MERFNSQDARKMKGRHIVAEVLTCLIMGMMAGRPTRKHALQWCEHRLEEMLMAQT